MPQLRGGRRDATEAPVDTMDSMDDMDGGNGWSGVSIMSIVSTLSTSLSQAPLGNALLPAPAADLEAGASPRPSRSGASRREETLKGRGRRGEPWRQTTL